MSNETPTLTFVELDLQRVLRGHREGGYGGRPSRLVPAGEGMCRIHLAAAHRGGPVYSPFGEFNSDLQVEWAIRVLDYLSEQRVEAPRLNPLICEDPTWAGVRITVEAFYDAKFNADRADAQAEYDADPDRFSEWNHGVVENGKVTDGWGSDTNAICRWFIEHMSQFTVFTVWQIVNNAVMDCAAENLGLWAVEDLNGVDPRKVAAEALETAMRNLSEHIDAALKASNEQPD